MDTFEPQQWHDFFTMVGGGAAALTGLLFVALSIQREAVAGDPRLIFRARAVFVSLAAIFARSALVLMGGQNAQAIGGEIFVVCFVVAISAINRGRSVARARRMSRRFESRIVVWLGCYALEMAGALWLALTSSPVAMYVVGIAIVLNLSLAISRSWLLMMGDGVDEAPIGNSGATSPTHE